MQSQSILINSDKSMPNEKPAYSSREEFANAISHGLGIIAGILALIFSTVKGVDTLTPVQLFGVIVYCSSIILLFSCSTLYHSVSDVGLKHKLKIADHCAIYLLIAGTYTPLMLIRSCSN